MASRRSFATLQRSLAVNVYDNYNPPQRNLGLYCTDLKTVVSVYAYDRKRELRHPDKLTNNFRSRQDWNLCGETPSDFESDALTTRPRLPQRLPREVASRTQEGSSCVLGNTYACKIGSKPTLRLLVYYGQGRIDCRVIVHLHLVFTIIALGRERLLTLHPSRNSPALATS